MNLPRNLELQPAIREIHCAYCESTPLRMTGRDLFPDRSDLILNHYLVCRACEAWVGCASGTWTPFGQLANAQLRHSRRQAHDSFDAMWRHAAASSRSPEPIARSAAYAWLSRTLGGNSHIAGLSPEQCVRLIDLCQNKPPNLVPSIRAIAARRAGRAPQRRH